MSLKTAIDIFKNGKGLNKILRILSNNFTKWLSINTAEWLTEKSVNEWTQQQKYMM